MARKPNPVSQTDLMSQGQLDEWLAAVKEFVRVHSNLPRNQDIKALISDWVPQVVDGTMTIRSARLKASDQKSELGQYRVLQHELNNTYLPMCFATGRRYRIAKVPHQDHYVLEAVALAPRILMDEDYRILLQEIMSLNVQRVTVVQHSGKSTSNMVGALVRRGVSIDLYLQDPAKAVNMRQAQKIESEKRDAKAFYGLDQLGAEAAKAGCLRIYKFAVPATIRAVIAGPPEAPLLISWGSYYYYRTDDPEARPSGVNIQGHLQPQILVEAGAEGFDILAAAARQFLRALAASSELWDAWPPEALPSAAK